jgi:NTE family protein
MSDQTDSSAPTTDTWVVDSPAVGTDLLRPQPCGDRLRPAPPDTSGSPIAVTLSGGGFRASLAGVGVVRLLADAGLLGDVRFVSSVSGGSVTNGLLAAAWPGLRDGDFSTAAVQKSLVEPFVKTVSRQSLKLSLVKGIWRTIGPKNRTELLADRFDEWFFEGQELEGLDPQVRWIVNAANLTNGVRFGFERDVVGDYSSGLASTAGTGLRLSTAVAASAAVPGAFAPLTLKKPRLPCAKFDPVLMDGGTYDNTGLEALDSDNYKDVFLVSLNAGGLLRPGSYGKVPLVRDLARANSLLYRQSTTLRTRSMVHRFELAAKAPRGPLPAGARRGVLTALATDFRKEDTPALNAWRARFPEHRTYDDADLAEVPTVFDKLDEQLCRLLVYRGWWLTGAALANYHPQLLGSFDAWDPPEV